ncbi:MAG: Na+/H+ antiporter NhaC family protein [Tessaracoccus sp.]
MRIVGFLPRRHRGDHRHGRRARRCRLPASDSTLGPTAGLNADGQHDHMRDSVIPTFIHFNIPLMIAGWTAAMVL